MQLGGSYILYRLSMVIYIYSAYNTYEYLCALYASYDVFMFMFMLQLGFFLWQLVYVPEMMRSDVFFVMIQRKCDRLPLSFEILNCLRNTEGRPRERLRDKKIKIYILFYCTMYS